MSLVSDVELIKELRKQSAELTAAIAVKDAALTTARGYAHCACPDAPQYHSNCARKLMPTLEHALSIQSSDALKPLLELLIESDRVISGLLSLHSNRKTSEPQEWSTRGKIRSALAIYVKTV